MATPFIGEIRIFAGNFAPRGWAKCDGQLLATSQNDALFALLGTTYGGNGRDTFGLPDLRGRVPIHEGSGPGLTRRSLGSKGGVERAVVAPGQIAAHGHAFLGSTNAADATAPAGRAMGVSTSGNVYGSGGPAQSLSSESITPTTGGGASHANVMPFQCVCFIICLFGIFPSRN